MSELNGCTKHNILVYPATTFTESLLVRDLGWGWGRIGCGISWSQRSERMESGDETMLKERSVQRSKSTSKVVRRSETKVSYFSVDSTSDLRC